MQGFNNFFPQNGAHLYSNCYSKQFEGYSKTNEVIIMATTQDFIEFVCEQVSGDWNVRYKKMFGEYMIYINNKPILIICDNTVYVKMLDCIADKMKQAETGEPYKNAKLHYILDIEDSEFSKEIITILESVTPLPKPKKKKNGGTNNGKVN